MRKWILWLMAVFLVVSFASLAQAASEEKKEEAIKNGLKWLATQQKSQGYWDFGGNERASTAAALLAFTEQYSKPAGWFGNDYKPVVDNAAKWLLTQTKNFQFPSANWWGFNGQGNGFEWYGGNRDRSTYESGLVIPALAKYATLPWVGTNTVVTTTGLAYVDGKTYAQVINLGLDSFVWGQRGPGNNYYGGWRYHPQWTSADNSTAQWPAVAMLYGQAITGYSVPSQTKTALQAWINYIQDKTSGGSGYDSPTSIVNEAKTGGLLIEMALAGGGGDKSKALDYLNKNWQNIANSTWDGNFGHPYAMWSIYKGLEVAIGLDNMTTITNLHPNPGDINNPNHGWNWWEDYCDWLVKNQNADGSWNGYSYWYGPLATSWNINILNATQVPGPVVPIPGGVLLLGSGLLSLLRLRQKQR